MMDDDFDDLDDYLDDFADEILDAPYQAKPVANGSTTTEKPPQSKDLKDDDENLDEEELNKQIEDNMANLFGKSYQDPEGKKQLDELMNEMASLMENAGNVKVDNDGSPDSSIKKDTKEPIVVDEPQDFSKVISSTMNRLKEQDSKVDESIKAESSAKFDSNNPEDILSKLLKDMSMDPTGLMGADDDANPGMFENLLQDMVNQLTSKSLLYEPLKNLSTSLPKYINDHENDESIDFEDMENYRAQVALIKEVLEIFESPDYSDDSEEFKDKVSFKMEALHEAGQPPKELMDQFPGGSAPPLNFDASSLPAEGCDQQ